MTKLKQNKTEKFVNELNSRMEGSEQEISELENRIIKIATFEQKIRNRLKKTEQSLRDLRDHNQSCSIYVFVV